MKDNYVTLQDGLVRDTTNLSILETREDSLMEFQRKKLQRTKQKELEERVSLVESKLDLIISLLQK